MPLLDHVRQVLQEVLRIRGAAVVVAVSGGADSLCLLHLLWRLRADLALRLHVAHLDHCLRGAAAAADAAFVREIAMAWDIPVTTDARDVNASIRPGTGIQAAARSVRYRFLAEVALATAADAVAVAHNATDQAETVLLHLLRGAGPAGLRGMRLVVPWREWASHDLSEERVAPNPRAPGLIRPLLDVPRSAIDAYCAAHDLQPRQDPSNTSRAYARSRIRTDLLPILEAYNSRVVDALGRSAHICADDYDYLQHQIDTIWPQLATLSATAVRLDQKHFVALHPALRRYALRRAVAVLRGPEGTLDFGHIEEACAAALSGVGARLVLPGNLHLAVVHGSVALSIGVLTAPAEVPQLHCERLDLPDQGSVLLPNTGWSARVWEGAPAQGRWAICCDKDRLVGPLQLRRRRPGDRIRRSGGRGSRRLQDLFVDHKIPQEQRDGWPLLSSGDALVWVAGLALDPRFAPDEQTSNRVCVELEYQ